MEIKQLQVEKCLSEVLNKRNRKMIEVLPAKVLLESGDELLKHCSHDIGNVTDLQNENYVDSCKSCMQTWSMQQTFHVLCIQELRIQSLSSRAVR